MKAPVRCPHPIGESQLIHSGVRCRPSSEGSPAASPMPRRKYAATTAATRRAVRRARRAEQLREHEPDRQERHPARGDGRARDERPARRRGRPPMNATATARPSTAFASTPWITVAVVGSTRDAGVAATSSARPASSSPRVWRTARNVLMRPASRARNAKIRKNTNWPSSAPLGVPRNMRIAGATIVRRRMPSRSAVSPNVVVHRGRGHERERGRCRRSRARAAPGRGAGAAAAARRAGSRARLRSHEREFVAVVAEEQLLERRRHHGEALHAEARRVRAAPRRPARCRP